MRVTIVNRLFGILRGGGEAFDLNMAKALQAQGCTVDLVAGSALRGRTLHADGVPTSYVRSPYVRWLYYRLSNSPQARLRRLSLTALVLDLELFAAACMRHFRAHPPRADIFQICSMPKLGARLATRFGIPTVVRYPGPPGPSDAKWQRLCAGSFGSGSTLTSLRAAVDGHAWEIPPGVDCELFAPRGHNDPRQRLGIPADACVLLFVGRFIPVKNLPLLMRGFAGASRRVHSLHLVMVGDGPELGRSKGLAHALGVSSRVHFTGARYDGDLAACYNAADIFALTSHYESFSIASLEAMASGLPVIATRVGHTPNLIEDRVNGLLVAPDHSGQLQDAIATLAGDRELRAQMGMANRSKAVGHYSWGQSARQLLALYDRTLSNVLK